MNVMGSVMGNSGMGNSSGSTMVNSQLNESPMSELELTLYEKRMKSLSEHGKSNYEQLAGACLKRAAAIRALGFKV